MRRFILGASALAVLVMMMAFAQAEDKAEKKALVKMPEKVQALVNQKFPQAKILSVEKETENGKVVYDVELKGADDLKYEMDILEDGTLIEIEKQMKKVPGVVSKAVKAKYPTAKIAEVMKVFKVAGDKETPTQYEVNLVVGEKKLEVIVSLDGKSVKEEKEEK